MGIYVHVFLQAFFASDAYAVLQGADRFRFKKTSRVADRYPARSCWKSTWQFLPCRQGFTETRTGEKKARAKMGII